MKPRAKKLLTIAGLTGVFLLMAKSTSYRSFLGHSELPRGIRNNNPGNLVLTEIKWQHKIPASQNTDGHFEQFDALPWGIRALLLDLRDDIVHDGKDTIKKLIYEYAPPYENNTEAYIAAIEQETGIGRNDSLSLQIRNYAVMKAIVMAISHHENGGHYLLPSDVSQAWGLI